MMLFKNLHVVRDTGTVIVIVLAKGQILNNGRNLNEEEIQL